MTKNPVKDKYNFALYVPVIRMKDFKCIDGRVTLYFTIKDPVRRFAGWLVRKSPENDLSFDELSSKVWMAIDGERTIFEIAKLLNQEGDEPIEESLRRVVTFFRYLAKRGWISFREAGLAQEA